MHSISTAFLAGSRLVTFVHWIVVIGNSTVLDAKMLTASKNISHIPQLLVAAEEEMERVNCHAIVLNMCLCLQ
jgi:hypothetical protein